jgi:hypothetical protein
MSEHMKVDVTPDVPEKNDKGIHFDFIKNSIPACLVGAPPARRKALKDTRPDLPQWYEKCSTEEQAELKNLVEADCHAQNQWDKVLKDVQDITTYAKPLLIAALAEAGVELDVEKTWLRLYYPLEYKFFGIPVGVNTDGVRSRTFSLLQAALHNFEGFEAEEGYFDRESSFITEPDSLGHFDVIRPTLKIQQFVTICRKLDIGGQYEKHVKDFFFVEGARLQEIRQPFINSKKAAIKVAAYAALLKADVELKHYKLLVELVNDKEIVTDDDIRRRISYSPLRLMGYEIAECALFFATHENRYDGGYVIAYIPDDPQHPIKKYASFAEFEEELTHQLMYRPQGSRIDSGRDVLTEYQRFFSRFISEKDRGRFFLRFTQKVLDSPSNAYWMQQVRNHLKFLEPASRLVGPIVDRHWRRDPLENIDLHVQISINSQWLGMSGIWLEMFLQNRRHTLENAQVLAVSTAAEDDLTRERRLANYLNVGMFIVGIAAFFVPPAGAAMMLITANQLLSETIEGVRELSQGDKEAGWAHITDVVENLATMAELAPLFHYAVSPFIEGLKAVTLPSGKTRLWKPDLKPYQLDIKLPEGSRPNQRGLHRYDGQDILPLEGNHYSVQQEAATGKYRVQHPARPDAYAPELHTNGSGAWRHELEQPRTWQGPELMKRLGHLVSEFSDSELEQIRRVSDTPEDVLRRMHVDSEPMPVMLADTISRFDAYKEIEAFIADMQSDSASAKDHSINQLYVMTRYGKWPGTVSIRVIDPQAQTVWRYVSGSAQGEIRTVQIQDTQLRNGELLPTLLEALDENETNTILEQTPGTLRGFLNERVAKLRANIAKVAESRKAQMLNDLYKVKVNTRNPRANLITARFPGVPMTVIEDLLADASSAERQQMAKWDFADRLQTKPIPLGLAEALRLAQRETRLARAYEGLYLDALINPDTERLALNTLKKLPGWPSEWRIEVRDGSFNGKLRASAGVEGAERRKVLVRNTDGRYEARDHNDLELHEADDFFRALQHGLPDAHRTALGLPDVGQGLELKTLIEQHLLSREELRSVLKMQPIKPGFKAPWRWTNGRLGYPLSGRGAGESPLLAADKRRVLKLFPDYTDAQIDKFLEQVGDQRETYLLNFEAELRGLRNQLREWSSTHSTRVLPDGREVAVEQYEKQVVASLLERCWQKRNGTMRYEEGGHAMGYELNLQGRTVGELPALTGYFSHVRFLDLSNLGLTEAPTAFLDSFPSIEQLEMQYNGLNEFPTSVTEKPSLIYLDVSNNNITLTEQTAGALARWDHLEYVQLSHNPLGRLPDFSQMTKLVDVRLQATGLTEWPVGLRDQPELAMVDLRDNQLASFPEWAVNPSAEHAANINKVLEVTELNGNPLSDQGMQQYADILTRIYLDDDQAGLMPVPPDVPTERGALGGTLAPSAQRVEHWLKDLPATEQASRKAQWALLDAEALEREAPGAEAGRTVSKSEEFFRLLEKLRETAEYKKAYPDLKARVWAVLDAAEENAVLRRELFKAAGEPETCSDRAALVFSELEIKVQIHKALAQVGAEGAGVKLLELAKGLFRLDEVEAFALNDIKERIQVVLRSNTSVREKGNQLLLMDQIEVRLSYRVNLRDRLDLPGQPTLAEYTGHQYVPRSKLRAAEQHVNSLRDSKSEIESIARRDFWGEYLKEKYRSRFDLADEPIYERMEQLDITKGALTSAQYNDKFAALAAEKRLAERKLIDLLTPQEILNLEDVDSAA